MVISIRSFFSLFLIVCLYWTAAQGEDEAVGRPDSMAELPANLDMGVAKARESITLTSSAGQGVGDFEVGADADEDSGQAGTRQLPDQLIYGGIHAMIAAEYMYRL